MRSFRSRGFHPRKDRRSENRLNVREGSVDSHEMDDSGSMFSRVLKLAILAALVFVAVQVRGSSLLAAFTGAIPPVFAGKRIDQALYEAPGRLVVANFSASWCGTCRKMNAETWRDEGVVSALERAGLAVYVNVDDQQQAAQTHQVSAVPTTIVFRNGRELGRIVGYYPPESVVAWLAEMQQVKP